MRLFVPAFVYLFLYHNCLVAQTFTASPGEPIRDEAPLVSTLTVSSLPATIQQQGFGVESVCLNIHYWEIDHLIITLYAPDGTMVKLTHLNGRDDADELDEAELLLRGG